MSHDDLDLDDFCEPAREHIATPFALDVDGVRMACATDGKSFVVVEQDPPERKPKAPVQKTILDILSRVGPSYLVAVADLRAWAGEYEGKRGACCPECDHAFDLAPPIRFGVLAAGDVKIGIDRNRVAQVLDGAPDETIAVNVAGIHDAVRFVGDGWRAAVMPVREAPADAPVFVLAAPNESIDGATRQGAA